MLLAIENEQSKQVSDIVKLTGLLIRWDRLLALQLLVQDTNGISEIVKTSVPNLVYSVSSQNDSLDANYLAPW